jgi:hypothetical protein
VNNWAKAVLLWNIALDGNGQPQLPGTDSCQNPHCRGVVTISGGSYTLNEECELTHVLRLCRGFIVVCLAVYAMAQASRAITPKDPGGPWGQRIGVNVAGGNAWALRVTAFVTKRNNPSDWWRYSIVVLNWYVPIDARCFVIRRN